MVIVRRFIRWLSGDTAITADEIKAVMFNDINCINFMRERRKEAHQMQGRYDGAMSDASKELYRQHFKFWDALIREQEQCHTPLE